MLDGRLVGPGKGYLIKELVSEFGEHIIPQKITHLESYFPYTVGLRWTSEKSSIHRNTVAEVLRTEGIPVATGISRLMSDNPMFQKQVAFGKEGFPFSFYKNESSREYFIPDMPNATRLQNEEYLGFFQVGWPNTIEDMNDIVRAFKKIFNNKNKLIGKNNIKKINNFISGR